LQHDIIELRDIARRADFAPRSPFDKIKDKPGQPPVSQPFRVFVRKILLLRCIIRANAFNYV